MLEELFVNSFQIFLIIFVRILGLFITAPFYSGLAIPARFRIGFAFVVSLLVLPLVIKMGMTAPADIVDYIVRLLSNFISGAGIGFFIFVIVTAFQVSAQIFSIPMGLGMNEVLDPLSEVQVPELGNILGILIMLLLIRVDGHFFMVDVIVNSFKSLDLFTFTTSELFFKGLLQGVSMMFDVALKIALPIVALAILLDMAMGLISRVAPQFNVMIMGFNIKILVGFVILWITLPPLVNLGSVVVDEAIRSARELIAYIGARGA